MMHGVRTHSGFRPAFSLVEASISTVIVAVMLSAALNTVGAARLSQRALSDSVVGAALADALMAEIMQQEFEEPAVTSGSFGLDAQDIGDGSRALWNDVDDYDNWSASPPQHKDGSLVAGATGLTRTVVVSWVSPASPEVSSGTFEPLKRIVVTVLRGDKPLAERVAYRSILWPMAGDEELGNE